MRIFIGGVMQASNHGKELVDQGYRNRIADALIARWPELEVIDPLRLHPDSVGYDDAAAKETLFALLYSFLWDGRWPTATQWAAAALFTAGILASIKAHR